MNTTDYESRLITAEELLKHLFVESSRPSVRTVRNWQKQRLVPFVKLGRLIRFDLNQVRAALAKRCTVDAKGML